MIAFPKTAAGVDPLTGAPADVSPELLAELQIDVKAAPEEKTGDMPGD